MNTEGKFLAAGIAQADASFVQGELSIDPVLVLGRQPVGAIERPASFLATGQGQFQRPPKLGSSLFQTNQRILEIAACALSSDEPRP